MIINIFTNLPIFIHLLKVVLMMCFFFFSSRRRHTRYWRDWSSDVCSSDLIDVGAALDHHVLFAGGRLGLGHGGVDSLGNEDVAGAALLDDRLCGSVSDDERSEERRVGKECRSRWSPYH